MAIRGHPDAGEIHSVVTVMLGAGVVLLPVGVVLCFSGRPLGLLRTEAAARS